MRCSRKCRAYQLLRAAWPLAVAEGAYSLIYLTDASMIARLGEVPLAALGTSLTILWVMTTFGVGYLATVSYFVSTHYANKRFHLCGMFAWQGLWTAFASGAVLAAALIPASPWIFSLFGHDADVFSLEVPFFQISILSIMPEMGAIALSAYFVAIGRPALSLAGASVAALSNLTFDYLLIWGHFGFPELGMSGSACSTVIASLCHFLFLFSKFLRTKRKDFETRNFRPNLPSLRKLAELGVPAGLEAAIDYFAWAVMLIALIGTFGTSHLAAGTIVISIAQAATLPADGIGTYLLAQIAEATGRDKFRLARIRVWIALRLSVVYFAAVAVILLTLRSPIMGLIDDTPEVGAIAKGALLIVAPMLITDGISLILLHSLQGAGDVVWSAAASILSALVVLIGGSILIIFFVPQWGSLGIWGVAALHSLCHCLLFGMRWRSGNWAHRPIR